MGFTGALIILLLGLGSAAALVYVLSKLWINWAPGNKRVDRELDRMRSRAGHWLEKLVPWERSEMELFSLNNEVLHSNRSFGKRMEGMFNSIYHEPMMYYSYREYLGRKRNAVLFIRTSEHEFIYRMKKGRTGVFYNDEPLGWMGERSDVLYAPDRKNMLARIQRGDQAHLPVLVEDREIAHLTDPDHAERVNPRAYSLLDNNMSERQEMLLLSITALELVEKQVDRKFNA